jgi:hypothetical protein
MNFILEPWQFFFAILSAWVHRQQQEAIEYLRTENTVLKELHGPGRILLNDDQRRRLAVKGKVLGRKRLEEVGTLFTPDTDRDTKFCEAFRETLKSSGVAPVLLPPRSPNLNAHLERFFQSLKSECLERMIFFGEQSLRNAVNEFVVHYRTERNHQGLENEIIDPGAEVGSSTGDAECRERLGGMLRYYYRKAA